MTGYLLTQYCSFYSFSQREEPIIRSRCQAKGKTEVSVRHQRSIRETEASIIGANIKKGGCESEGSQQVSNRLGLGCEPNSRIYPLLRLSPKAILPAPGWLRAVMQESLEQARKCNNRICVFSLPLIPLAAHILCVDCSLHLGT